jgi:hypothetical protein
MTSISTLDRYRDAVEQGVSLGAPILDRLVASGQLLVPERFAELEAIEAKLGVELPELLTLVDNEALRQYVQAR